MVHMGQTSEEDLANIILAAMDEQGKSFRSIAEASHIPKTTLTRKLQSGRKLTVEELGRIATALGTTPTAIYLRAEAAA